MNRKQQQFVDAYCANGFNATKAALEVGYSSRTAYSIGQENLKKPEIAEAISTRLDELVMSRAKALTAMSDIATSDIDDFLTLPGTFPYIDLDKARRLGVTHLIKKVKVRRDGGIELELYDRQTAIRDIGKHHGLWKDGVEITVNVELVVQVIEALQAANIDPSETFQRMIQKAHERTALRSD